MFSLMILLALMATGANAELTTNLDTTFIGIYASQTEAICEADLNQYATVSLNFFVHIQPGELAGDAITASEFRVENLPVAGAGGLVTPTWSTTLAIGTIYEGLALAWTQPLPGPWAYLGRIDLFVLSAQWVPADTKLRIADTLDSFKTALVDADFIEHLDVLGTTFVLNCSGTNPDAPCVCDVSTAVEDASWGSVKSLY